MALEQAIFRRSELLLGDEAMSNIAQKRVIIFGVGGVGSWCAESLVRSGIKHLTIVDSDRVCITNINRQLMATSKTVGQVKVDALKDRLLSINPSAEITALQQIFTAKTADSFNIDSYDYIIRYNTNYVVIVCNIRLLRCRCLLNRVKAAWCNNNV